jgi:streptogramin lyase
MDYPDDYPAPDPDGRPHIWLDFNVGRPHEWDLGRLASSAGTFKEQHLELGEGLGVVLVDDDGDEWMLVDATVDRFNPQRNSPIVRIDWSTFRRMPKLPADSD